MMRVKEVGGGEREATRTRSPPPPAGLLAQALRLKQVHRNTA